MSEPDVTTSDGATARAARAAMLNLSRFHREHERHYALAPLEGALALGRAARTLTTLADRWAAAPAPAPDRVRVPFAGCEDLNDAAVIPSDGVLYMEGEGEPPELARLRRDVIAIADDQEGTGAWLASAMEASWTAAGAIRDPRLADVLGERHRIIANDWQAAGLSVLAGRLARRAVDLLARTDLTPGASAPTWPARASHRRCCTPRPIWIAPPTSPHSRRCWSTTTSGAGASSAPTWRPWPEPRGTPVRASGGGTGR